MGLIFQVMISLVLPCQLHAVDRMRLLSLYADNYREWQETGSRTRNSSALNLNSEE
jgi:hypothetical protein